MASPSLSNLGAEPYSPPKPEAPTDPIRSSSLSGLGAEPYKPPAQGEKPPAQEGILTESARRLSEGATKIGAAIRPNSGVQNLWGIPGSGRVGSAISGAAEIVGAPLGPIGYIGSRGSAASVNDQSLDARISRAEKLKRENPGAAGADPDVNALPYLKQQRAIPEAERIRQDQERARSLAEDTTGMFTGVAGIASPGWALRTPANAARALRQARGLENATDLLRSGKPIALRGPLAQAAQETQGALAGQTARTGGHTLETVPVTRPAGTQSVLNEAERILTGGARGPQRTLEAAQDLQTGRGPLDLGQAGKRVAAQRGTYQPPTVQETERTFVRNLEQELTAPTKSRTGPIPSAKVAEAGPLGSPELRGVGPREKPTGVKALTDSLRETWAPQTRGAEARDAGLLVRKNIGILAKDRERNLTHWQDIEKSFGKAPREANIDFIRRMERGETQAGPALNDTAAGMRDALTEKWRQVQQASGGRVEGFVDNYFPHMWEADPGKVAQAYRKAPLGGSAGPLHARQLPSIDVGLKAGLKLKSDNPATIIRAYMDSMDRYLMSQRTIGDLSRNGLAVAVKGTEEVPEGWRLLPPQMGQGRVAVPTEVAQLVENHLSPGAGPVLQAARNVGNGLNQAQLGISGFHYITTGLNAVISDVALGIQKVASPGVSMATRGHGLLDIAKSPLAPFSQYRAGGALRDAYRGIGGSERLANMVDTVASAGGRASMDPVYALSQKGSAMQEFKKALAEHSPGGILGHGIQAGLEAFNHPLMQKWVPQVKLGTFQKLAEFELSKLGPQASELDQLKAIQKAWDSIDNRFGQLVYANTFWNNTAKSIAMLATRSVGWTYGTVRELGGGALDLARMPKTGELTPRAAYTIALPIVAGTIGAMTNFLLTGEMPKEPKDYFWPRTGKVYDDGSEERIRFPSYINDAYSWLVHPLQTPINKMNPIVGTAQEMFNNEDFYKQAIVDPEDSFLKQGFDWGKYLAKRAVPISLKETLGLQQEKPGLESTFPGAQWFGVTRAPRELERSAEQQAEYETKLPHGRAIQKKRKAEAGD